MQENNKMLIPISILIAGALIAGAVFFKSKDPAPETTPGSAKDIPVEPLAQDDHVLGSPNAAITVIEYSDIDCPFCAVFHETMHRIINDYGKDGSVAWVYRNLPLDQLHAEARGKAEAAECVALLAGNETYWEFLDALFSRSEKLADVPAIAAEFGVNQAALAACTGDDRTMPRITADESEAIKAGDAAVKAGLIQGLGTPLSIILTKNGEKFVIAGAQPYDVVKQVIDTILAGE